MAAPRGRPAFSFADAIRRELADGSDDPKRLRTIADKLISAAESGDIQAIREVADRLDGKPKQAVVGGSEDDPPVSMVHEIRRVIVGAKPGD